MRLRTYVPIFLGLLPATSGLRLSSDPFFFLLPKTVANTRGPLMTKHKICTNKKKTLVSLGTVVRNVPDPGLDTIDKCLHVLLEFNI